MKANIFKNTIVCVAAVSTKVSQADFAYRLRAMAIPTIFSVPLRCELKKLCVKDEEGTGTLGYLYKYSHFNSDLYMCFLYCSIKELSFEDGGGVCMQEPLCVCVCDGKRKKRTHFFLV